MTGSLQNKVALVTGGSRGIGASIVRRLSRDGAAVAFTYAHSKGKADELARAIQSEGGRVLAIQADSADPAAIVRVVNQTVEQLGRLDILVNSAGIAVIKPIVEFSIDDFDQLMAINVRAVFAASKEAARHLPRGGRIITIGSTNADRMPFAGGSVYAMSKAAVAGFTRGLARDLGPREITVNAVQPGPVDTEMNPADGPFAESLRGLMAIGRFAKPDEIAGLVSYLAQPEAAFVTGACLTIDGGFAA